MALEFYGIILVAFVWLAHVLIDLGIKKINSYKDKFKELKIPLIFDEVYLKENFIKIKYLNISDKKIIGFNVIIEVLDENGKICFEKYYVDKTKKPLKRYYNDNIILELTKMAETEEIINVYPIKVVFSDGSYWELKKV